MSKIEQIFTNMDWQSLKAQWFVFASGYAISFFTPITGYIVLIVLLLISDLYTGIRVSKKTEGRKLESKGLRATGRKVADYFLLLVLARGMEVTFFDGTMIEKWIPITYIVGSFVAWIEFKSNLENISILTGIDIWKHLVQKLKKLKSDGEKNIQG